MDIEYLENFCEKKGKEIAKILLDTHDPSDFEVDATRIEGEIYDVAISYAKILFFEAEKYLDDETKNSIKSHIDSSFHITKKQSENMKDIDLIAHWIKLEIIRELGEHDIVSF